MEQATQPTTPTAPSETRASADEQTAFQRAAAVAADIVGPLYPEPFSVRIEADWPAGWRVCLVFRDDTAQGVYELATRLRVPVTEATIDNGVHLDVCTRVKGIEVCGAAFVSPAQAAALRAEHATDEPDPSDGPASDADSTVTVLPTPEVAPLGASVTAYQPMALHTTVQDQAPGGEE